MILESLHVRNFRSILNETLYCENLTALVGANGSGKSSFLQALNLFYSTTPKVNSEDYYNGDVSNAIVISITFKYLSEEAVNLFSGYLQDNKLTVERVLDWNNGRVIAKYHGASSQNPAFQPVRDGFLVKDRGNTAKQAYNSLRGSDDYRDLPAWSNIGGVQSTLKEWESKHPEKCERQRDDGQFFGFEEVAQGYLGRFTKFLFIPAVRDASDDTTEGRGTVLTNLMDLVVRSVIANREEIVKFREDTQKQYEEMVDPSKLTELNALASQLTNTLKIFVPDASVDLKWLPLSGMNIPMPQADVKLVEDGYSSAVERTGHGLQRAFILTMLQHLALAQTQSQTTKDVEGNTIKNNKLPNLFLAIEEPELYQHPNRQRHLVL